GRRFSLRPFATYCVSLRVAARRTMTITLPAWCARARVAAVLAVSVVLLVPPGRGFAPLKAAAVQAATALSQESGASREDRVRSAQDRVAALSRMLAAAGVETLSEKRLRQVCHDEGCDAARQRFPNIDVQVEQDIARQRATANRVVAQVEREVDSYVS